MKLVLVILLALASGLASAEHEYVKVNDFNISFELNLTHDVITTQEDQVNGTAKIRTFDGAMEITVVKLPKPSFIGPNPYENISASKVANENPIEILEINGQKALFWGSAQSGKPIYNFAYVLDHKDEKFSKIVLITSDLSLYTTSDLIRSLRIVA